MAAEKSTARKKSKNTRHGNEPGRLNLVCVLQEWLRNCPIHVLKTVERYLIKSNGRNPPGHPKTYPDSLVDDLVTLVRAEMKRQETLGKKVGAKKAIRNLLRQIANERKGEFDITQFETGIEKVTEYLFKVYESARKRGLT